MNNYQLYRKHQCEIFEMIYDVWRMAPVKPLLGFISKDEEDKYNQELNSYIENAKPKIESKLVEWGFIKDESRYQGRKRVN